MIPEVLEDSFSFALVLSLNNGRVFQSISRCLRPLKGENTRPTTIFSEAQHKMFLDHMYEYLQYKTIPLEKYVPIPFGYTLNIIISVVKIL
jgi:hypothetical protein